MQYIEKKHLVMHPNSNLSSVIHFFFFHPKQSFVLFAPCKVMRIPESGKFFLVKSRILGFGIWNTAQGIRNPTKDWNPEAKFH